MLTRFVVVAAAAVTLSSCVSTKVAPLGAQQADGLQGRTITITHRVIPGANHYFYNHLPQLEQAVESYLEAAGARA
ncbi:MAG: hypothetical protein HC868_03595 [Sphingomonadales bacterium]|nr:hypothetical protein [Sphingomonadales bacterium]